MKVVISATLAIMMWSFSASVSAFNNRTADPLGVVAGRPLSLEKLSRVMHTEVSNLFSASKNPSEDWKKLIDAESARILFNAGRRQQQQGPSGLRRSMLPRADTDVTPFLVCEIESGVSGQVRKQVVIDSLRTDFLMYLYNKDDMSCFAVRSTFPEISELPSNFETAPIVPEMKIPHGTMDAIDGDAPDDSLSEDNIAFGRIEAILCPGGGTQDFDALFADIVKLVKEEETQSSNGNTRALRVQDFVNSRSGVLTNNEDTKANKSNHNWHRSLSQRQALDCQEMVSQALVDTYGDTIMFAFPPAFQGNDWRACLKEIVLDLALHDDVCFVGAYRDFQILNDVASGVVQSGSSSSKPFYDVGLDGTGQVVALSDSGIDTDNCYFYDTAEETPTTAFGAVKGPSNPLARKVVQYVSFVDDSDASGHGTHVAGSIAGRRSNNGKDETSGKGDGVAKGAKLAFFDIGKPNGALTVPLISTVFATGYEDAGARIHSASWGSTSQNSYSSFDHNVDSFMYDHPDFLFVVAAGNSGRDRKVNSIASPGHNKNGITVGATQNGPPHINNDMQGPNFLAEFSSRGPTTDGRMKPDVVAPGMYIESARADPGRVGECDDSNGLNFKAGTSMATPIVAGAAALVRQYFQLGWHESGKSNAQAGFSPRASLIKAVLLNGAVELDGIQDDNTKEVSESSAYDKNQGFGRVNLLRSLPIAGKNNLKGLFVNSKEVSTSDKDTYDIMISSSGSCNDPLTVALVWTDPPIGPTCSESCVVNDLDLSIVVNESGKKYYPNGLTKPDDKNNAERIRIDKPIKGSRYTVHVKGKQLIEPQKYSLAITGCLIEPTDATTPAPTAIQTLPPTPVPTLSPTKSELLEPASGNCEDTEGSIMIGTTSRTCSWLEGRSLSNIEFWCYFIDVARTCPRTCGVCNNDLEFGGAKVTEPRLDGTVRYFGNSFEIRPRTDITLMSFDVHLFGSSTLLVEVWTRAPAGDWKQMCKSQVTSLGRFQTVPLPEKDCTPVGLAADSVLEIYITIASSKDLIMIANANWALETDDFTLSNGAAVSHFDGSRSNGYGFDGSVRYKRDCSDNSTTAVRISDWAGDRTCSWLAQNINRMGFTCEFTSVVLHCPETCGFCEGSA